MSTYDSDKSMAILGVSGLAEFRAAMEVAGLLWAPEAFNEGNTPQ